MSKVIRLPAQAILYLDDYRRNRIRQLKLLCKAYGLDEDEVYHSIADVQRMSDPDLVLSALEFANHELTVDIECLSKIE